MHVDEAHLDSNRWTAILEQMTQIDTLECALIESTSCVQPLSSNSLRITLLLA